ncbi:hypothetical protein ACFE04_026275 [Oxalis oulophora]
MGNIEEAIGCVSMNPVYSLTPSDSKRFPDLPNFELQGFTKAMDGMKPGGQRRIILPPNGTSFPKYRVVDVMLHDVEHVRLVSDPSTDPNSSIAGKLKILRVDAMQGWSLL